MRRWLTRLLKPARQEARVLRAQPALPPVIDVLSETADIVTDALREGARQRARQHRQELAGKKPDSPLPFTQAAAEVDALPPSSLSVFPNPQVDPRFRALSLAGSPNERQRLAARLPELRPPHRCLSARENLVLEWSYWDGLSDADIEQKLGGLPHVVRHEALRKLAKHVAAKRKPVQEPPRQLPEPYTPYKRDPRLAELLLASTVKQRKEVAAKHPGLRPPHDTLNEWENRLLELAYWQGYTYKEIDKTFGFSAGWASNKCDLALRKLVYHSLHHGIGREVSRLEFAHIPPDPRLTELEKVQGAQKRIAVVRLFPELRPPHSFLNDQENTIMEHYYWQGHTYLDVAQHCGVTRNKVREVRNTAIRKLHREYRRTQAQRAERDIREPEATHIDVTVQATPLVLGQDARITALRRLGPPDSRRKIAGRYPELRPPHDALNRDDNDLLELALWQGRPYAEIASRKGLTSREVSNGVRGALERLNRHLCRDSNDDEDHLETVLLALNECRSVGRAAKKLRVSKDVLQAFIERAGIKSRIVFEVEP